jgi:hypothetical protein
MILLCIFLVGTAIYKMFQTMVAFADILTPEDETTALT